jgi:stalled ribosome rescue protein Dom34
MKQNHEKKVAGIWMDNKQAFIISRPEDNDNGEFAIHKKIEAQHYHGEKGEHASMNAEPQNLAKYHKEIAKSILNYDHILVFGPGKAQEQLVNFLREDAHFNSKQLTLEASQHLTDHQLIAKVRDFFS